MIRLFTPEEDEAISRFGRGEVSLTDTCEIVRSSRRKILDRAEDLGFQPRGVSAAEYYRPDKEQLSVLDKSSRADLLLTKLFEVHGDRRYDALVIKRST